MTKNRLQTQVRILVVLPLYGGSLTVGRYCGLGLKEQGHIVETFEAPDFYPAFQAVKSLRIRSDRMEYLENGFLKLLSQAVLEKVDSFEPDLVLAMAQAPLTRQALKRLRKDGVPTAMWFVEDFRLFTYWRTFAPWYDYFAVIQKEPFISDLHKAGAKNVLYLPLAAHPGFHQPLELGPVDRRKYGSDVSFLGAGYPNRRNTFKKLLDFDFRIWGSEWEGDEGLAPYVQRNSARIDPEEAVKIFNAAKINLNLHSSVQPQSTVVQGDFVNPRTYEIAGCGGFQLVDERSLLPEQFDSREMATFADVKELKEKIDYFLRHPEERRTCAERARERVIRDHTYAQRMQTLLTYIRDHEETWPKERIPSDFTLEFPADLSKELDQLLVSMGLSRNTEFPDLIWSLRQQEGTLTPLETALLFLDEWKKQYARQ